MCQFRRTTGLSLCARLLRLPSHTSSAIASRDAEGGAEAAGSCGEHGGKRVQPAERRADAGDAAAAPDPAAAVGKDDYGKGDTFGKGDYGGNFSRPRDHWRQGGGSCAQAQYC